MKEFALLGYPLGHTLSPFIHSRLFGLSGTAASYFAREVAPHELDARFDSFMHLSGFNVTIPYKQQVAARIERLDQSASRYMSVNVVDCAARTGYNTDVYGFLRSVEILKADLGGSVLLLGSGGLARMVAVEAALKGADLTIAVRPQDALQAGELAEFARSKAGGARIKVASLSDIGGTYELLVNATPVGMHPVTQQCPVSYETVASCGAVFDAVYNPAETLLLKYAARAGVRALGGMDMLVYQAAEAHRIWYGAKFPQGGLERIIRDCRAELEGGKKT